MKRYALVLGLAVMAVTASTARAGIVYQYVATADQGSGNGVSGVGAGWNVTLANGATTTVTVYLQETLTGGSASYIAANGGLYAAGYQVNRTAGGATGSWITGQTALADTGAALWGGGNSAYFPLQPPNGAGPTQATTLWRMNETEANSVTSGVPFTSSTTAGGTTTNLIALGSFLLKGGTTATTLSLGYKTSGTTTQTYNDAVNLQNLNTLDTTTGLGYTPAGALVSAGGAGPFLINVSVGVATVPEPGSMALCGFAACSMGFGAWRRYRAKKAADAEKVENVAV